MFPLFWRALCAHAWLRRLCAALLLSSAGNGLSHIVLYAELLQRQAPPASLALGFVLSSAPGWLGSLLGEHALRRGDCRHVLILGELAGLAGLGLLWHALTQPGTLWLQLGTACTALGGGMALPALAHYGKARLSTAELPAAALLDTLAFSCHVLLGVALGVLLQPRLGSAPLLLLDAASFIGAIGLLLTLPALAAGKRQPPVQPLPRTLPARQRRALAILPALGAVGAPAMALLPALLPTAHATSLLPLLLARSLGQLCGPLLVPQHRLGHPNRALMLACLAGFSTCYLAVAWQPWPALTWALVFLAHLLSNVVFSLGWHGLLLAFDAQHAAAASARSYRAQVLVAASTSLLAGWLAGHAGAAAALLACSLAGWLLAARLTRQA